MPPFHRPLPRGGRTKVNPWWNERCAEAVRTKRHAYKIYRRTLADRDRDTMIQTKHACKRVIAEEKLRHWTNYVETLGAKPDLAGAWKKIKKMRSQYRRPECPLVVEGRRLVSDSDKAEALADAFAQASSEQYLPDDIRERRRRYERTHPLRDPVPDYDSPINGPLSMTELKGALAGIKKVSVAAGPDGISYRVLRELPPPHTWRHYSVSTKGTGNVGLSLRSGRKPRSVLSPRSRSLVVMSRAIAR